MRFINDIDQLTSDDRAALNAANITVTPDLDGFVSGGELVVNRSRIKTAAQAAVFAAHEILGHVGLRALYGPDLNKTLDNYYARLGGLSGVINSGAEFGVSLPDQYPELVQAARVRGNKNAQRALVQEVIARAAETTVAEPGSPIANAVSDFTSRVKSFMARVPLLGRLFSGFSQRDIMRVVRESGKAAKQLKSPITGVATAASFAGTTERAAGIKSGDRVVYSPTGETLVITPDKRGKAPDGGALRSGNTTRVIKNVNEEAQIVLKQKAQNAVRALTGTAVDQLKGSRDPIKRAPDKGTQRKKINESSTLINLQKNFADSTEPSRRVQKKAKKFLADPLQADSVNDRIEQTVFDVLEDTEASDTVDVFGDSPAAVQARLLADVEAEVRKTTRSADKHALNDTLSLHEKITRYRSLAIEKFRDLVVDLDGKVDTAASALASVLGTDNVEQAMKSAGEVMYALSSIEQNNALHRTHAPLDDAGRQKRALVLKRLAALDNNGSRLSEAEGAKLAQELEQIGRAHYNGPGGPGAYDAARLDVNSTGLSTRAAQEILDFSNVTDDNYGVYTGIIDATKASLDAAYEMRKNELPQAYWNERTLHGFKHNFPVESVDIKKYPLYANSYTQRGYLDYQSETERKSQFTDNTVYNARIQAQLASQGAHFNSEVMRSLAFNVLANKSNAGYQDATGNFYDVEKVGVISKNTKEFREYITNQMEKKSAGNTFMYALPDSDAVVVMKFSQLSDSPKAIRGERVGEELRDNWVFKTSRTVTGGMSVMTTRMNANFIPRSHVREFIMGGLFIAAEEGLGAVGSYLSNTLDNTTAAPDIYTYMRLRNTRTPEAERQRKELLRTSPTARALQDLIEQGGLVTQLSAISEPGQAGITRRNTSSKLANTGVALDNWVGSITDASDAIVRLSAYQAQLAQGKSKQEAANYAKRLANFESRGRYSGPLGDLLMFYNPTAIGAGRFAESMFEGEYARPALIASVGAGIAFQMIASAFSPDDDENPGKKLFDREGMDRQTTDIRIPIGDLTVAIPAGFSVMSMGFLIGNQLGAFMRGRQDMSQLAANTFEVMTSNFSPIPASSVPLVDAQGQLRIFRYAADSITPSGIKPIMQFFANLNGLGLPIYKTGFANSAGGLTDAFNGRESDIGTWAERLAVHAHENTSGKVDINPGSLRHFMGSYFTAINTVLDFGAEAYNLTDGVEFGNSFVDRSLGFGGFISKTGHNDEYYKMRRSIDALSKQVKEYENTGRTEAAKNLRERLPPNFDELILSINRNKRAQDKVNSEMRPIIYGAEGSVGEKRAAVDVQNERRRLLQAEGLDLMRQIVN